jgi:PAS domain S-box-containing protein
MLVWVSMAKGWFFVAMTSVLLYFLVRRLVDQLTAAHLHQLELQRERKQPPPMLVAIANSSTDAIFAKDEEGRYLLINTAASRFIGKPPEDVLGHDDRTIFPPEQAALIMAFDQRVRETRQPETNEETLLTLEGPRVFLATKGPLQDAQGKVFGTFGISRDITERKAAEVALHDNRERLRLLVDHAPAALAMFDREMRYLEVSRRWRDDYFLGDQDVIGRSHYDVFPEIPAYWREMHRRGLAGETLSADEDAFERLDGSVQWLRWELRPWREADGTVGGIVLFSEDISKRKLAEHELKQRNEELERFNLAAIGRELRMIELKRQVNALTQVRGQPPPYDLAFTELSPRRVQ